VTRAERYRARRTADLQALGFGPAEIGSLMKDEMVRKVGLAFEAGARRCDIARALGISGGRVGQLRDAWVRHQSRDWCRDVNSVVRESDALGIVGANSRSFSKLFGEQSFPDITEAK
jgi:hypothetical protein